MEQKQKKNKKLLILLGVLAAVLVLLLGGLVLAMCGGPWEDTQQNDPAEMDALAVLKEQLADPDVKKVEVNEEIITDVPLEVVGKKTLVGTGTIRFADTVNTDSAMLVLQSGADVTLDGVTIDANARGNGIYVPVDTTFVLKSGTVQFANAWNVYNDGTFEMKDGLVTGAQKNNIVNAAEAKIAGGEISAGAENNIQILGGTAKVTGGNILNAGTSGIYVAEKAELKMDGELIRVRESAGYGVEVHGTFTLDYGNILKNGTDNVYVSQTGTMIMNDGYIATAVTCGIKSRGVLEIHGGIIEYNGTDGVDTGKTCVVDGGSIVFNTRRGFTNATGGTLTIQGKEVDINANKFGLYNEVGAVATLKDLTIRNSGTNNIRNFGELNLYDYVSKDSTSVHLSTLSGSKVYMENVVLDTNSKSHGIYNYAGTIEFKDLTITNPVARGIRNIGGTVIGKDYVVNGTFTTGLTNENVEDKVGYMEIDDISITGDFDYGIYNFAGTTKLTDVKVGVTNKNSLKVEAGNMTITDAVFEGCNAIPGQPDVAVYDAYFTGGKVTLNDVTLKNSYSSLVRNRSAQVTMNNCVLTGSGAAAINNSELSGSGAYGNIVCNNVTFKNNKTANVKNDCAGSITLNDCYLGLTKATNVAAEKGKIILNDSIIDGTAAEGEKVGFVVFEEATGIMKGDSVVRNTYGKGISVLGTFYMYDGTVTNCSSRNGAGLNNEGTFYVYGGTVKGNTALEGSGGAIRNKGNMYISGLLVEDNTAHATGGAVSNGGEMTIENTTIRDNKTVGDEINGGAIYAAEGTLSLNAGTVIEGNVTSRHGGALAIKDTATVIINDGVQIKNNTATVGSGGAAINYGTLIMNGGTIADNNTGKHGGGVASSAPGVFQFNGGTISDNTAGGNGGGVYHGGGSFTLDGGVIVDNKAATLGGSIAIGTNTSVTLSAGAVSGGKAEKVAGVYIADETQVFLGAEAKLEETVYLVSTPITLLDVRKQALTAQYEGYYPGQQILKNQEGASQDYIAASVPAVSLVDCEYTINNEGYLVGDTETGYVAQIGDVKYIALESAFAAVKSGETIELLSDCTVSTKIDIKNITGQITLVGNGFTITHGAFDSHMFTVREGVTLVLGKEDGTDTLIVDGGNLTGQTEARLLGVAAGGKVTVNKGTTLQNSYSSKHGGAVLLDGGELTLNGGTITGNISNGAGGAVFAQENAKMTIISGTISSNKALTNHGGALYFKGGSTLTMTDGSITGNSVDTKAAGAIMLEGGHFTMNGGSITNNTAKTLSGAIHVKTDGSFTMNGGSITGNTAGGVGGAVNVEKGSIALNGGSVTGNTGATTNGIHVADGVTVSMGGNVVIEDIYLAGSGAVVTTSLANNAKVNFSLATYEAGRAVLTGDAVVLADAVNKVTLTDTNWQLNTNGCLEKAPVVKYVAKIQGGESYLDLASAVTAAKDGDTIILLDNVTVTANIPVEKQITILGGGFTITHGEFGGNLFTVKSGGVLNLGDTTGAETLILDGGNLTGLTEARLLGVAAGGKVTVNKGTTLQNSYSSKHGGAILLDGGELTLNGGTITGNTSNGAGGAVFAQSSAKMTIVSGTVSNNKTLTNHGGALYFKGGSTLTMTEGSVTGNSADTKAGGAIFLEGGIFTMNGGSIANNTAKTLSGAIHIKTNGSFTMNGGSITGNTAGGIGGAVNAEKGSITLNGGTITGNTGATTNGIYAAEGVMVSVGGKVVVEDIYLAGTGTAAVTALLDKAADINITLDAYEAGRAVLTGDATVLEDAANKVTLSDNNWILDTNGCLKEAPVVKNVAKIQGGESYLDLASAVAAAQDGDTVILLSDTTVTANISVGKQLTILGDGFTITHGAFGGNLFTVTSGGTLTFGKEDGTDTLIMDGGNLTGQTEARLLGVAAGGKVVINKGTILQNSYSSKHGGAILLDGGELTLNGGTITGNTSNGVGGAVFAQSSAKMTIVSGTVSNNKTLTNHGGALYFKGGSTLTMTDGSVTGNSADAKAGGAVFLEGGIFTMNGGSVANNTAKTVSGAVHVKSGGSFTMNGGTITGNTAGGIGGAVNAENGSIALNGGSITGNAGLTTNGVYVASGVGVSVGGNVVVDDLYLAATTTVSVTKALGESASVGVTIADYSGYTTTPVALYTGADTVSVASAAKKTTLHDTNYIVDTSGYITMAANAAMAAKIGTTYYADLPSAITAAQAGDVISLMNDITVDVAIAVDKSVTILGNGNTITHGNYAGNIFTVSSSLTLGNAEGTDSLIVDGANLSSVKNARGFIVPAGGTLTINKGVTLQNVAASSNAGCILVQGGTVNLNGGKIVNNNAVGSGAAIFMEKASQVIMNSGEISGNTSAASGGAIYIKGGSTFTMNNGKISGNESTGKHGGAIFLETATDSFVMNDGEISGNTTNNHGGAVCVSKGTFTLVKGSICNNTAKGNSGGVHVADAGALNIQGGKIEKNTATGVGGNIAVAKNSFLTMTGGAVGTGTAGGNGKAIYIAASSCGVKVSGGAVVEDQFYLDGGATITINGALTADAVAVITLPAYVADTVVLKAEGVTLADYTGKFTVADTAWMIGSDGKLRVSDYAITSLTIDGNNIGDYSIVTQNGESTVAAVFLQDAIAEATGHVLRIVSPFDVAEGKCAIAFCSSNYGNSTQYTAGENGYGLYSDGKTVYILGSDTAAEIYAAKQLVYTKIGYNTKLETAKSKTVALAQLNESGTRSTAQIHANEEYFAVSTKVLDINGPFPEGLTYNTLQGSCSDGTYAYFCLLDKATETGGCSIFKYRMSDWSLVKANYNVQVGHGNTACYVDSRNQLMVVDYESGGLIHYVDVDTLEIVESKTISFECYCATYEPGKDQYVFGVKNAKKFNILDNQFNITKTTSINSTAGDQGVYCDENYIYLVYWNPNSIVVYDWDCNYVNTIYLDTSVEAESMFIENGTIYVAYYISSGKGGQLYTTEIV